MGLKTIIMFFLVSFCLFLTQTYLATSEERKYIPNELLIRFKPGTGWLKEKQILDESVWSYRSWGKSKCEK